MQANIPIIRDKLKHLLDGERFAHCLRVQETAIKLARFYNVDIEKACIAGLLHDCAKYMSGDELKSYAAKSGKVLTPIEEFEPKLLHSYVSAVMAKNEFGIDDKEILGSIEKHTLGCEKMTRMEEIVYLADHIEEKRDYRGIDNVRELAYKDINKAIIQTASAMINHLLEKNLPIEPTVINMRNAYILWMKAE